MANFNSFLNNGLNNSWNNSWNNTLAPQRTGSWNSNSFAQMRPFQPAEQLGWSQNESCDFSPEALQMMQAPETSGLDSLNASFPQSFGSSNTMGGLQGFNSASSSDPQIQQLQQQFKQLDNERIQLATEHGSTDFNDLIGGACGNTVQELQQGIQYDQQEIQKLQGTPAAPAAAGSAMNYLSAGI